MLITTCAWGAKPSNKPSDTTPPNPRVIRQPAENKLTPLNKMILMRHAKFLNTHPNWSLQIQGHTDERESREYNIGIAELHATRIYQELIKLGVATNRLEIESFGEEHPLCTAHTPICWQRNRRVELVYKHDY